MVKLTVVRQVTRVLIGKIDFLGQVDELGIFYKAIYKDKNDQIWSLQSDCALAKFSVWYRAE